MSSSSDNLFSCSTSYVPVYIKNILPDDQTIKQMLPTQPWKLESRNDKMVYINEGESYIFEENGKGYHSYVKCDIYGLWEFSDKNPDYGPTRWDFKEDGTFLFYTKDQAGNWILSKNKNCVYFVSGNMLATRWSDANGKETVECWTIEALRDIFMRMFAYLQDKDDEEEYLVLMLTLDKIK